MRIETVEQLRAVMGFPSELTQGKIYQRLTQQAKRFIGRSPFMVIATANAQGMPTASPKGDEPGFVRVENDDTLLMPERRGNKLLSSFLNVLENPRVGLIFFVPGCVETLRVSGTAELLNEAELARRLEAKGTPALLTLRVTVTEAYFHCGKALIRSELWNPPTWPQDVRVSFGEQIGVNLGKDAAFAEDVDAQVQQRYCDSLY
jgi:PPOX class probable FMN-dependent enzyme